MKRKLVATQLVLSAILAFLCSQSRAGQDAGTFKPTLPADVYKELTKRSIATIETIAKSTAKDAAEKCEAEAAILVGYTLSVKDDDDVSKLRGAALEAVKLARGGQVKKLAEFSKTIANATKTPANKVSRKEYLQELQWMMENFRGKNKGGEGLHADLQYHPKLKNLNGTEAFIGAIAGKKLSDENLDKIAKELPNFAYRVAIMGAITHEFAPEKDAVKWRELSMQMRDASVALADAGQKKNADGVFKAAQSLEASCTQCHMVFKKN
jgi:hypothetical protein